jgi:tRNA/rRNA methyltransferase
MRDRFSFVLFRPKEAGNVGAAARALKNMGFTELRLVAPCSRTSSEAVAMAVHGRDLLERAQVFDTLGAAVADCALSVGTTCRKGPYRSHAKLARAAASELISESASNRIAIVFGPEDTGLTNDELKLCHRLLTIPGAPDYRSLNLAQAVMIVAYELMLAATVGERAGEAPQYAPATEVDAMLNRMAEALVAIGFLPEDNPDHVMFAIRAMLGRSGVTERELDVLSGIASQIRWFAEGGREVLDAKRLAGKKLR